ncbi:uncharacterized protein LOC110666704 [Hevea brasiliensis]|uniref:uncharacterized protein LOC110666704 n=1 Tax=Hevea brasiliensis TaxID=3981 RepID=UPI0025DBE1E0|nr:uncharacterized protein LOC110666704 [Hevea brasiliensis]
MQSYAKFLNEILSNKSWLKEYETVVLTKECSAILQNKLPPKLKDRSSFSIPYSISKLNIDRAICDIGASVSLMPLLKCEKLKLGELKPTTISLQLVDRSIKYPIVIIENIQLKVGKFFIPVDFMVIDMEENVKIQIILGRHFLVTIGANIDMKNGRLTFNVGEEEIEFNLFDTPNQIVVVNSCFRFDVIENGKEIVPNSTLSPLSNRSKAPNVNLKSPPLKCKEL